jgi:hypothetical protein
MEHELTDDIFQTTSSKISPTVYDKVEIGLAF